MTKGLGKIILAILFISACTSDEDNIVENYLVSPEGQDELILEFDPTALGDFCQEKNGRPPSIDNQNLVSDKALIQRVNVVNSRASSLEILLKEKDWEHTFFDIGNDLVYHSFQATGAYLNIQIGIIGYRGREIEYEVRYDSYETLFGQQYYDLIEAETVCEYGHLRYMKWNLEILDQYQERYPDAFWLIPKKGYRNRRFEAIDFLTYYPASEDCWIRIDQVDWAYWKMAMDHVRYLIVFKDIQALEWIINSPNREGRIIGAATLTYLQEKLDIDLPPELVDRKNEVLKKDGRTITSGLSLDHWGDPAEALDVEEEFDRLLTEF